MPSFGRIYPPDRWLPLRIELRNNGESAVEGLVVILPAQGSSAVNFRVPVSVPGRSRVAVTAFAYLPEKPLSKLMGVTAPVAIAEWLGLDGVRLARSEVLGRPDTAGTSGAAEVASPPGFLLLAVDGPDRSELGEAYRVEEFANFIAGHAPYPINLGKADPLTLPRHRSGYDAVRAIIFNGAAVESLDPSQRQAIVEYLLGGGVLVLPAPLDEADPTGTWLAPYMPVHVIGGRKADRIHLTQDESSIPLRINEFVNVCEAIDAGGKVLLRDANYIHAAFQRVGLGRVVFISFPIDALDHTDSRTTALWNTLLDLDAPDPGWSNSALEQRCDSVLEAMIGVPTAPWSLAVSVAGGYALFMLLIHLLIGGARRPAAFAVGTGVAAAVFAALVAFKFVRRDGHHGVSGARVALVELGSTGGGVKHESLALFGRDDPGLSLRTDLRHTLRPRASHASDPPTIDQLPFATPNAGIRSGRIAHIWQASAPIASDRALQATIQFTGDGVRVDIYNQSGQAILAPLLLWEQHSYRLPNLPPGRTSLLLGAVNPRGDFTNALVLTGEEVRLRSRIVELSRLTRTDIAAVAFTAPPQVVGWLDPAAPGLAESIIEPSTPPNPIRAQIMCRVSLQTLPSPAGEAIHIPAEFVQTIVDAAHGAPYDPERLEWVQSLLAGAWNVGFRVPARIGTLGSVRATIRADLAAPGHTIVLRRGQCIGGALAANPEGPIVAEWDRPIGSRTVTVELDPTDMDAGGCFWLRLAVDPSRSGDAGPPTQWRFNDLSVAFVGQAQPDNQSSP